MDLTSVQRDILTALINIYRKEDRAVKGEEIAELIDRTPGTIRNQMQSLKVLNLVEGIPGPRGGYKATSSAYEALNFYAKGDAVVVPITKNGIEVDGATASEIAFTRVMDKRECDGTVRILGKVKDFDIGDRIRIGPTPVNKLYIRGDITGKDDTLSRLIFHITEIISVPRIPVKKIARRAVQISPDATLQEAAKMLVINGALAALVDDDSPGLICMTDLAKALADGRSDLKVGEITSHSFISIDSEQLLFEAVKIMGMNDVNQLVVLNSGNPWGMISPIDIVRVLTPM